MKRGFQADVAISDIDGDVDHLNAALLLFQESKREAYTSK